MKKPVAKKAPIRKTREPFVEGAMKQVAKEVKKAVKKETDKIISKIAGKKINVVTAPVKLWFAFDTETTGLVQNRTLHIDRQPEIVEFYGVQFDPNSGKLYDDFDQLIKPAKRMNEEQISHHHINNEMLEHSPVFAMAAPSIKKLIEEQTLIFAHNLAFDKDMVEIEFQRLNQKVAWPKGLCTVEQTKHFRGWNLSLTKLHDYLFKEPFDGAHRASADVAALVRCIVELHKRGKL